MANRPGVKYIQYYTDGSAARQPEVRPPRPRKPLPKARKKPVLVVPVCPMTLCGLLAAAVLLVMLVVGSVQLWQAQQEKQAMADYVDSLEWNNARERKEYENSLDLENIRKQALALGMIPVEQVPHMELPVPSDPVS